MSIEVIAIVRGRVTAAAIDGVADDATPARIRAIDPDFELSFLDVTIEIEVAHARLDQSVGIGLADFEDTVHALQVEHHAA